MVSHHVAVYILVSSLALLIQFQSAVQGVQVESSTDPKNIEPILRLLNSLDSQSQGQDEDEDHDEPKVILNPKLKIRNSASSDSTMLSSSMPPVWSFVADQDIEEGEILTQIPWRYIFDGKLEEDESQNDEDGHQSNDSNTIQHCRTVQKLVQAKTARDKNTSSIDPYLDYLWSSVPSLPSSWSHHGRAMLLEILGGEENQLSPPGSIVSLLEEEMVACKATIGDMYASGPQHDSDVGNKTSSNSIDSVVGIWKWAAAMVQEKSHHDMMVPLWDLYTHRNGHHHNVRTEVQPGVLHRVRARRRVAAGETLHKSYDFCDESLGGMTVINDDGEDEDDVDENPCVHMRDAVENGYGTPEIFRDYGIVEDFPQRWTYQPGAVAFDVDGDQWLYAPEQITFTLELIDQVEEKDVKFLQIDNGIGIQVVWADHLEFDNRGRNYVRRLFRRELRRLYRFQNVRFDVNRSKSMIEEISQAEWESIRKYYLSLIRALKVAIHSLVNNDDENDDINGPSPIAGVCGDKTSSNEGFCPADWVDFDTIHYDDLKDEEDVLNYIFPGCPTTQLIEFYEYKDLEIFQTNYQKLTFLTRPRDRDLCLNIENTLQICSNYRPHYHEFFVHFPARYLQKIERVIFIGGGDSMLLHEVLKYPDLEKVVGLELDQQVTRKSFKYFQSPPHFDDSRVEWWYGDATKSLPLLPKEYWGTFDLVLVDLSETVMSMKVTGELNIFSALSLLLKPNGIMVKNEPYIDQFSAFFDHTIQLFYGSPKICTQVLVMGSNQIDFLHSPVQNHESVQTLLIEPMKNAPDRFKFLHDYRKNNATEQGKCNQENEVEDVMYGKKAGLLEIVDLDGFHSAHFDLCQLQSSLHALLQSEGFVPISAVNTCHANRKRRVLIVMKEGFVVIRPWPEYNYIALDIQLWGAFSKLSTLRSKLVRYLEASDGSNRSSSSSISSYRIVTGGMFGTHTWEADKASIGIQMRQTRNCNNPDPRIENDGPTSKYNDELTQIALGITISKATELLAGSNLVVLIACGLEEDKESCTSFRAIANHPKVAKAIPIWACPGVVGIGIGSLESIVGKDGNKDLYSEMYQCEKSLVSKLDGIFGDSEISNESKSLALDMFVLDPSAPYSMAQIYNSILGFFSHRDDWFAPEHILLAPIPVIAENDDDVNDDDGRVNDPEESTWRRNFLERYRKEYHRFPLFRAELLLRKRQEIQSSASSMSSTPSIPWMNVGILSTNDRHFFHSLATMESSLQDALNTAAPNLSVAIERVTGGLHYYDTDHDGEVTLDNRMYYPESYDRTAALEQFRTQRPLARHSVFQFEFSATSSGRIDGNEVVVEEAATTMPSWNQLEEMLMHCMTTVHCTPVSVERHNEKDLIGDGALVAISFSHPAEEEEEEKTSFQNHNPHHNLVIMFWDGRVQVDVHLFSSAIKDSSVADEFATTFERLSGLSLKLRDDQPRGYGRVVNFESDILSVPGRGLMDDETDAIE